MTGQQLIPHLFRTEAGKITAVLCKLFGPERIEQAEDITSETFLAALEVWPYKGIPENPVAWLYAVAKNKAKNQLARQHTFTGKIADRIKAGQPESTEIELDLSDKNISDSQLQMLFAICQPVIPVEAQTALALRILCGLGIDEIANAFLTNKETINKRLFRAKEKLRTEAVKIEIPGPLEITARLNTVLTTLYLLFNEGYYSESNERYIREELCLESMRLTHMLIGNEYTNLPQVRALLALMCFHSSRLKARKNGRGEIILYQQQDESQWDRELIAKGAYYLKEAAAGSRLSKYHLEATIAYWHTVKEDTIQKWESILHLYDQLLTLEYSPVAALNRAYAVSKIYGKTAAIKEAEKLNLEANHYYYVLLGTLYEGVDQEKSILNYKEALALAKTSADKQAVRAHLV